MKMMENEENSQRMRFIKKELQNFCVEIESLLLVVVVVVIVFHSP